MKNISATSLLFLVFACSKQQPAQEPSDDFEKSSVDQPQLSEPGPAYSNSNPGSHAAHDAPLGPDDPNADGRVAGDAPAASNAVSVSAQSPRRAPAERTISPPSGAERPSSTAAAARVDNTIARADNTDVNERDRSATAKTPLDQSNTQADLDITQAIRKAVVGDKALSFNAKNVKIITEAGRVTLRGPVASADERVKVVSFAKQASGVVAVDDQLEIAP